MWIRSGAVIVGVLVLGLGCNDSGGGKRVIVPNPDPPGRFSPAVAAGNTLYLAGQLGRDPKTGQLAPGGIQPETAQALKNIEVLLQQAGLSTSDVVKCTVFLVDLEDYGPMNEVYMRVFNNDPPARSAVAVAGLVLDAKVEIECIAAMR